MYCVDLISRGFWVEKLKLIREIMYGFAGGIDFYFYSSIAAVRFSSIDELFGIHPLVVLYHHILSNTSTEVILYQQLKLYAPEFLPLKS